MHTCSFNAVARTHMSVSIHAVTVVVGKSCQLITQLCLAAPKVLFG